MPTDSFEHAIETLNKMANGLSSRPVPQISPAVRHVRGAGFVVGAYYLSISADSRFSYAQPQTSSTDGSGRELAPLNFVETFEVSVLKRNDCWREDMDEFDKQACLTFDREALVDAFGLPDDYSDDVVGYVSAPMLARAIIRLAGYGDNAKSLKKSP